MARTDTPPSAKTSSSTGSHSVLKSIGKAIFAPSAGAHDGVTLPHADSQQPAAPKPAHPPEDEHHPRMLTSIGKAMLAPIEGSHGGLSGVSRHRPTPPGVLPGHRPETLPDQRDPRVVGKRRDSVLESFGKSVVAPVEGADEGAGRPGSLPPDKTHR
jgi:hypothetical protein